MSIQPALADYVGQKDAALERRSNLLKELDRATPEQKPNIQSFIDAVEQEITKFDRAIRNHQPSH